MNHPTPLRKAGSARETLLDCMEQADTSQWESVIVLSVDKKGNFSFAVSRQTEDTIAWCLQRFTAETHRMMLAHSDEDV